ncbi:MAG: hypothetical protein ACOZNI_19555 [Myxococcota bacterium]
MLLWILGCAAPAWGTWMFTKTVSPPDGSECQDSAIHNFTTATTPEEAATDTGWVEEASSDVSDEVFFGRLEKTAEGAVLIVGGLALPGAQGEDGGWVFQWDTTSEGVETDTHASGYLYQYDHATTETLRVEGAIEGSAFTGLWETSTRNDRTWDESDLWTEEAAAYVGENGEMPVGDWLVVTDDTGAVVEATNAREVADCGDGDTSCTLAVSSTCVYRSDLTGVATELAGEDAPWTEDAGQAAGE